MRIVIADNDEDIRGFFARILNRLGYDVVGCAADGEELVSLCRSLHPDLVVTDIEMPSLSGIEAIEALPKEDAPRAIIVSSSECPTEMLDKRITTHLLKPVSADELATAVAAVL